MHGRLFDVPVDNTTVGASTFLPLGVGGIFYAVPYGMWFFLGIEALPLAAEEAKDPAASLPRALATAMTVLCSLGLLILLMAPSGVGS